MSDDAKVQVESFGGRFGRVRLPMGLVVDRLSISGREADISTSVFHLSLPDWADLEAELTSSDLADFLNTRGPSGVRDFEVRVAEGQILVSATAKVIVEIRVTAVCTLVIRDRRQLFVQLEGVEGVPMARGMIQGQLDQINPILDVSTLPFPVELDRVEAGNDVVKLMGRARAAG